MDLGRKIFTQKSTLSTWMTVLTKSEKGVYNSKELEKAFKEQYDEQEPMMHPDFKNPMKKCFLLTTELNGYNKFDSVLLRNYEPKSPDRGSTKFSNATIVQALRASSAAPFYLSSVSINDSLLVDGGVLANNPTYHGVLEAKSLWGNDKSYNFVSLGTGIVSKKIITSDDLLQERQELLGIPDTTTTTNTAKRKVSQTFGASMSRLLCIGSDSERIHSDVQKLMHSCFDSEKNRYWRWNVPNIGDIDLAMSDPVVVQKIYDETRQYILNNEKEFKEMCDKLVQYPFF
jgi:hypothetical protein